MRPIRIRNAARPKHGDQNAASRIAGFTFADTLVVLLVVGIVAAIAVFAVSQATHHTAAPNRPPECSSAVSNEVAQVRLVLDMYKKTHDGQAPATLAELTKSKPKFTVPKTTESRKAGFAYVPATGTYSGPCLARGDG